MARGDLLKRLFLKYMQRDDEGFRETAEEIILEERKKSHPVLANELARILNNSDLKQPLHTVRPLFDPPPRDIDRKTHLLEVRQPDRYLEELILTPVIWNVLNRIMAEVREWDVLESRGLIPIRRVIFCGPSGCGKTVSAEAIACELGLPMVYVRFDAVVSSLLGETAANLRKVFDYANRGQWVLFFDEFDAIGRSRDDVTEHGELKRVINSFLQILDNFSGRSLVIAATNFEQVLDPALWRRFDEIVRFGMPDVEDIHKLLLRKLNKHAMRTINLREVASRLKGHSHADVERVAIDCLKSCALRGTYKVESQDLESALKHQEYRQQVREKATLPRPPIIDKD